MAQSYIYKNGDKHNSSDIKEEISTTCVLQNVLNLGSSL